MSRIIRTGPNSGQAEAEWHTSNELSPIGSGPAFPHLGLVAAGATFDTNTVHPTSTHPGQPVFPAAGSSAGSTPFAPLSGLNYPGKRLSMSDPVFSPDHGYASIFEPSAFSTTTPPPTERSVRTPESTDAASPVTSDRSATPAKCPLINPAFHTEPRHDFLFTGPLNYTSLAVFPAATLDDFGACPTGLPTATLDNQVGRISSLPPCSAQDYMGLTPHLSDTFTGATEEHGAHPYGRKDHQDLDSPNTESSNSAPDFLRSAVGLSKTTWHWAGNLPAHTTPTVNMPCTDDTVMSRKVPCSFSGVQTEEVLVPNPHVSLPSSVTNCQHSVASDLLSPPRWMCSLDVTTGFDHLLDQGPFYDKKSGPQASPPSVRRERAWTVHFATRNTTLPRYGYRIKTRSSSVSGRETDKKRGNRQWKCSMCGRSFERRSNLRQHADIHDPQRKRTWHCPLPYCGDNFSRKHDAQRHIIKCHAKRHEITQREINLIISLYPTINLHPVAS